MPASAERAEVPTPASSAAVPGGAYAVLVLSLANLLNFLDRFVVTAVLPRIQADLGIGDAESGALGTVFMVVFMLTAPIFGRLGDRCVRTRVIAAGIAAWSLATAAGGLARGYGQLLVTRALVGTGEASCATIAPTIIADYYPPAARARALSFFFAAMPVGAAIGFILGALIEERWGWRAVFYVAGLPGLLVALLALTVREPLRGSTEPPAATPGEGPQGLSEIARSLLANGRYVALVAGYTAYVFAVGGLAFWMPTFLHRVRGMDLAVANTRFGAVTVVGGLVGAVLGGWAADRLLRRTKNAHAIVCGVSTLLAAPCLLLALLAEDPRLLFGALLLAEVLLFASQAPVNTAIVGVVATEIRATALAASITVQHLLGDAISPTVIGWISDRVREGATARGAPAAQAAAEGLQAGVLIVPAFVLLGGIVRGALALRPWEKISKEGRRLGTQEVQ